MIWRPHVPIDHDLTAIAAEELREGIWAKVVSRCGIVRNVTVITVSDCKRYAVVCYGLNGPKHHVDAAKLLWFTGSKPTGPGKEFRR
ncbi:MAG: hypothetical protein ABIZ04_20915 [Opitutus sp.]